jgi:hypothetical protein
MSVFATSPRLLKGALVTVPMPIGSAQVIAFQYNPDTLNRTLQTQGGGDGGERSEALRLKGAPAETLRLEVELDATDALERGDATAGSLGIHPQLAALELLIYPPSALVIANTALLASGTIEIVAPEAPMTLLVWGPMRVLPVRLTEFTIAEEMYDPNLNPIRAKVALGLRVLSYNDLGLTHPGYHLFLAHQATKESLASLAGRMGGT